MYRGCEKLHVDASWLKVQTSALHGWWVNDKKRRKEDSTNWKRQKDKQKMSKEFSFQNWINYSVSFELLQHIPNVWAKNKMITICHSPLNSKEKNISWLKNFHKKWKKVENLWITKRQTSERMRQHKADMRTKSPSITSDGEFCHGRCKFYERNKKLFLTRESTNQHL